MAFTYGNWIFFALWVVATILVSIWIFCTECDTTTLLFAIINFVISLLIVCGIMAFISWQHTNTASGIRTMKDYQSEMANGIEREITVTAEDGREIFHYEGKVDIESNHTDNYIKFESEEGKRYIIYYGITDSIIIEEK